jgi:hypothetical protein
MVTRVILLIMVGNSFRALSKSWPVLHQAVFGSDAHYGALDFHRSEAAQYLCCLAHVARDGIFNWLLGQRFPVSPPPMRGRKVFGTLRGTDST